MIAAVAATPASNHESDGSESDENSFDQQFGEHMSDETKIHRILLLRSWLFHFVNTVHSYFMTRVVHSTELELRADLSDCSDLVRTLKKIAFIYRCSLQHNKGLCDGVLWNFRIEIFENLSQCLFI